MNTSEAISTRTIPLLTCALLSMFLNCCSSPIAFVPEVNQTNDTRVSNPRPLKVTSWNLGYGGLGKESDFKMDGGEHLLPPSKDIVRKNAEMSAKRALALDSDVLLFQEFARPSFVNRNVNAGRYLEKTLAGYSSVYLPDFKTRLVPWPFRIEVGMAVFFRSGDYLSSEAFLLEQEPTRFGLRKTYQALVVRLDISGEKWALINTHLAAFDENGEIRIRQAEEVLQIALKEEQKGFKVLVGGDWNLLLAKPSFPHTTKEEKLFWLRDTKKEWLEFPKKSLPKGWTLHLDETVPTVRTLERPYLKNENFVGNIDGFVSSPATKVSKVFGTQYDFESSDHNPVTLVIE